MNMRVWLGRLVPAVIFLVLSTVTAVVWRQQVGTQQKLLQRHAEDVTVQGARRLGLFVEFRLKITRLFARRWTGDSRRDFSRQRFSEFARVVMRELPGIHAFHLIPPDLSRCWTVGEQGMVEQPVTGVIRSLAAPARRQQDLILGAPFEAGSHLHQIGVIPLLLHGELLGYLAAEFDTSTVIDACFQQRIRSEFSFVIFDGQQRIYHYGEEALQPKAAWRVRAAMTFPVANRTWTLQMMPKRHLHPGWGASLPVPLLGLALSVALAMLVHALSRRMDLYRQARDRAIREIEQREQAQQAMRASEAQYRSIFASASDGFVVMNTEGQILDANPAAAAMHGYSEDDLRGKPIGELIAASSSAKLLDVLRLLAPRGPVRLESTDRRKDGSTFEVEVRGSQLIYGDAPAVLACITDMTERRLAAQRHALLARKVLLAQEEERARIARELHDELGQLLTALRLELDFVRKRAAKAGEAVLAFETVFELVEKAAAELRRICRGLRPPLLDDLGVDPAVRLLVNEFKERTGILTGLDLQVSERKEIVPEVALCVYRILQESLTNISRHSGASQVDVRLTCSAGELNLVVVDNGKGFDPEVSGGGSGLEGMRERCNLVDGSLNITSELGKGSRVEFRVAVPVSSKEVG